MIRTRWFVLFGLFSALSCSAPIETPDASDAATDSSNEGGVLSPSRIFGPCVQDSQCGTNGTCLKNTEGYPNGMCSRTCTDNTNCLTGIDGIEGYCGAVGTRRMCLRACINGYDCGRDDGYTCVATSSAQGAPKVCVPACRTGNCGAGAVCNPWTQACQSTSAPNPTTTGQDNGGACTQSGDCRSRQCVLATSQTTGLPTGWNGGYCYSSCSLPEGYNVSNFWAPRELPQSNCPTGSICWPDGDDMAERDQGTCYRGCANDSDCRASEGYFCQTSITLGTRTYRWNNGRCLLIDCVNSTRTCPTGYFCETRRNSSGNAFGICRPGTPGPEAGPEPGPEPTREAGTDAGDATTDIGSNDVTNDIASDSATINNDATSDINVDTNPESSVDAGVDAPADSGVDASADADLGDANNGDTASPGDGTNG